VRWIARRRLLCVCWKHGHGRTGQRPRTTTTKSIATSFVWLTAADIARAHCCIYVHATSIHPNSSSRHIDTKQTSNNCPLLFFLSFFPPLLHHQTKFPPQYPLNTSTTHRAQHLPHLSVPRQPATQHPKHPAPPQPKSPLSPHPRTGHQTRRPLPHRLRQHRR